MTTRLIILIVLLLGNSHRTLAQDSKPQELSMTASWKKGDKFIFQRIRERLVTQQGKLVPHSQQVATIAIEILDKTEKSSTVSWTSTGISAQTSGGPEIKRIVTKLLELTRGSKVVFMTDVMGRPNKMVNAQEVAKFYTGVIAKLDAWMKATKVSPNAAQSTLQSLKPYANAQTVPLVALRDPLVFFTRFEKMVMGKPINQDIAFPNPADRTGQSSYPAKASTQYLKRQANFDFVEYRQTLDEAKAKQILLKAKQEEAIATGQPLPTEKDIPLFRLQNLIRLAYDRKTGLPQELSSQQTTIMGPNGSINIVRFRRADGMKKMPLPASRPTSKPTSKSTSK